MIQIAAFYSNKKLCVPVCLLHTVMSIKRLQKNNEICTFTGCYAATGMPNDEIILYFHVF